MAADYMERHAKLRKKSWHRDELMLQRDLLPWFGNHKAKAVSRRNVNALLDSIMDRGAPVQANRTLQILKRIYNWGISREIVEVNPCAMIRPPGEEKPRERVLSEDELQAVWHALEPEEVLMTALFRLRILTAQRGGEVATMRRPDLDLAGGWWTIPAEFSKNGLSHRVPLSPWVIEIVEEALASADDPVWVFPSAMKDGPIRAIWQAVNRIRRRSGVGFRPHDLRRTAASLMTGMGISRLVVAKILNHVDPSITAVYDRHGYDNEKRQALEAWSARVQEIVTGRKADDGRSCPCGRPDTIAAARVAPEKPAPHRPVRGDHPAGP